MGRGILFPNAAPAYFGDPNFELRSAREYIFAFQISPWALEVQMIEPILN